MSQRENLFSRNKQVTCFTHSSANLQKFANFLPKDDGGSGDN